MCKSPPLDFLPVAVAMSVALVSGLLLLLLGQSVAMAPGDGNQKCPVPEYPVNVKVLMDSWNYSTADWISTDTSSSHWSSEGTCGDSSVSQCSGGSHYTSLFSKFIDKDLPAPDLYSVKIFVNITYSFMKCRSRRYYCDDDIELKVHYGTSWYSGYGIMPDNIIRNTSSSDSGTKQFYFISQTLTTEFSLALVGHETCVTVSRVLVYRYECPGHDRQSTGLGHRPATQAPVTGAVVVNTEMSYTDFPHTKVQQALICTSQGKWLELKWPENQFTHKENRSLSTVVKHLYSTVQSTPTPTPDVGQTAVIMDDRAAAEDSGCEPQTALLAVVAVLVVVIFTLVLVVVALIIALVGTNRKLKLKERNLANSPDRDMSNPVYDPVGSPAAPNVTSSPSGATTGNGTTDQEEDDDDETLHNFSNNLYSST